MNKSLFCLWTHPRCCGTTLELSLESLLQANVEVNWFDDIYYNNAFFEGPLATKAANFKKSCAELLLLGEQPFGCDEHCVSLVRSAAYTIEDYLDENYMSDWELASHTLVCRHPYLSISANLRLDSSCSFQELGYQGLLTLYTSLVMNGIEPIVIDSQRLLENPTEILKKWCTLNNVTYHPRCLEWKAGFRSRWGRWPEWKEAVSSSTGFRPFRPIKIPKNVNLPNYEKCLKIYNF
jgi:hypothetical protein